MKIEFIGVCRLELDHTPGNDHCKHSHTAILLEVDRRLDESKYLDSEELPTKEGSEILTQVFVQGLIANIHNSHVSVFRDSAEHLRFIISELERGFVQVAKVTKGVF